MVDIFVKKVYIITLIIYVVGLICICLFNFDLKFIIGFSIGTILGLLVLQLFVWTAEKLTGAKKPSLFLTKLWVLKYPVLVGVLYLLIARQLVNPIGFCIGFFIFQLAIMVTLFAKKLATKLKKQ